MAAGKYVDRHRSRGKLLARERIERDHRPWDGISGTLAPRSLRAVRWTRPLRGHRDRNVGMVHGRECLFVANDATVKGGVILPNDREKAHPGSNGCP